MTDYRSFKSSDSDELQLRALVVDDNALNRALMQVMLTELGCSVRLAEDGEEASRLAAADAFDLIVMDLRMPVMDGDGATRRIRAEGASRPAFIVRWTTDDDIRPNGELYDGELPKPLTCSPLVAAVALASRRALYRLDRHEHETVGAAENQPPKP